MVTAITHDGRHGAEIYWEDFKAFMTGEFTAGKNMLKGDYVLPGGQQLPFGLIIKRLKRHMLLSKIMAGGEERDNVTRQHNLALLDLRAEVFSALTAVGQAWRLFHPDNTPHTVLFSWNEHSTTHHNRTIHITGTWIRHQRRRVFLAADGAQVQALVLAAGRPNGRHSELRGLDSVMGHRSWAWCTAWKT